MLDDIFIFLEDQRETIIRWQDEMTSRPALSPENNGKGEIEKAKWICSELKSFGITAEQIFAPDDRVPSGSRPNIIAKVHGKQLKTLWIIAHMDVVPAGDSSLWKTNPFSVTVDGDHLIGRGVTDNQQAIVSAMLVAKALEANNIIPNISLGLMFVADEETGMTYGIPHILKEQPNLISSNDLVIVPDMGTSDGSAIELSEKGCLWLCVSISGKQCHASTPENGINSLLVASECILAVNQLHTIFNNKDFLFNPPHSTFIPTKKENNVENINTIPGKDVFYIDCRLLPCHKHDDVVKQCQHLMEGIATKYNATVEVEQVHYMPAAKTTSKTAPVITDLVEALRLTRNIEPCFCGSGGQTVASILRSCEIDVAVWSTIIPNAHAPNEYSSIRNTIEDAKTFATLLFNVK